MLRRLILKAVAIEGCVLPSPALTRGLPTCTYCTSSSDSELEEPSSEDISQKREEKSFCNVSFLGRVRSKPTEFQNNYSKVKLTVGIHYGSDMKWYPVTVWKQEVCKWVLQHVQAGDRVIVNGNLYYNLRKKDDKQYKDYYIVADSLVQISKAVKDSSNEEMAEDVA
ncbi:hypothetical protein ACF0H5_016956 [Mactra antiquata]